MNLTSGWLVHGSQAAAVVVAIAAVVWWPGRGAWRKRWSVVLTVLARLATMAVVVIASVVALALSLNAQFGLLSTWGDLKAMFQTQVDPGAPESGVHVEGGGLTSFSVTGPLSHYTGQVDVWTPPGYQSRLHRKTYPVLMAMHGWPGSPLFVQQHLPLLPDIEAANRAKKLALPIVVMPQWGKNGVDTECTNGSPSLQLETWLAKDLPLWLKAHYRVKTGPENWAIYGYSAGAWCARMLTMNHPGTFGAAIDLSGYSRPLFASNYVPFSPTSSEGQSYDMIAKAELDPPNVSIYMMVDPADTNPGEGASYTSSLALKNAAQPPLKITWVPTTGGHTTAAWNPQTVKGLEWLGRTLKGFKG